MVESIRFIEEKEANSEEITEKESLEIFNLLIQQDIDCLNRTR